MIAHCRHHDCKVEIVLTDTYTIPLCPEHGGTGHIAQQHRRDRDHQAQVAWARTLLGDPLGDDSLGFAPPIPRDMAGPVRRDAIRDFWGDRG